MLSLRFKISIPEWLPKVAIIFFINLALVSIACFAFRYAYKDKIYPGVHVGQIDLGGKYYDEAEILVREKIDKFSEEGVKFVFNDKEMAVTPVMTSLKNNLAYEIIKINPEETVDTAFSYGRSGNFFSDLKDTLAALVFSKKFPFAYTLNESELASDLKNEFGKFEAPGENASFKLENNKVSVKKEIAGKAINYEKGIKLLKLNLTQLDNTAIKLYIEDYTPTVHAADAQKLVPEAEEILKTAPISLKHENNKWEAKRDELVLWLSIGSDDGKFSITTNDKNIKRFLQEKVTPKIDKEPRIAKFQIAEGRVTQFEPGQDGIEVKIEDTIAKIKSEFLLGGKNEIDLVIGEVKNEIGADEVNNLGLKEIIGTGESNFAGSPANRIHNIKTGANALNGVLIKPGEEFSLLKTLGPIDGSTGYKQELVIKNNRTIPEYGGGLCQIGTTMFRGTLKSGLDVTQRRNHSYRVSYYEPAGTDATIYDPWPDYRFINDTGNHILIQSRFEGTKLFFDFWGTKDGRIATSTQPTIYNIVKPAPTKIIETTDLAPGKKKCTEKAHNGADAYFDYTVTYPNGEVKEKRFTSHYVPWQEVCLLGVEKLSDATSTPAN